MCRWPPSARMRGSPPAPVGPARLPRSADAPAVGVEVAVVRAAARVEAGRRRARGRGPAPAAVVGAPWLLALSAAAGIVPVTAARASAARLAVPALSQMES